MSYTVIKKHISTYNNINISDKTILQHIGETAYCILYFKDKSLYEDLVTCDTEHNYQLELDIIDTNLSSKDIKLQILGKICKDKNIKINSTIDNIIKDSKYLVITNENNYNVYLFIFISLLFIISIICVLYVLGFFNYIFKKQCTSEECIKSFY